MLQEGTWGGSRGGRGRAVEKGRAGPGKRGRRWSREGKAGKERGKVRGRRKQKGPKYKKHEGKGWAT
jgi:hypothetical protein